MIAATAMAGIACAWVAPAHCNGDKFFRATEIMGHPEYVLFGSVRDGRGRYLSDAEVTVYVAKHMLYFSARTNVLGRFRTPDVGRAIKDLGYEVDPSLIQVSVSYPDYHIARREYRGKYRQKSGALELNFIMERNRSE